MQINTLNKIVNVFVVGFLANIMIIFYLNSTDNIDLAHFQELKKATQSIDSLGELVLVSIPLALFWGVVVEALANLILQQEKTYLNHNSKVMQWLTKCLVLNLEFKSFKEYRNLITEGLSKYEPYKSFFASLKKSDQLPIDKFKGGVAVGSFLQFGSKDAIEYAIQYISLYSLSTNFIIVLFMGSLLFAFVFKNITIAIILIFLSVFIFRYALYCYYFSYNHVYRSFLAFLIEKEGIKRIDVE